MYKIGFIGSGKMASALVSALLKGGLTEAASVVCSDVDPDRLDRLKEEFGVHVTSDNAEVLRRSEIVFLAFKPQNFPGAIADLAGEVRPDHIIVSILAGIPIGRIRECLPGRVFRVMPNTACLVGEMAGGFAAADDVCQADREKVQAILRCAGSAVPVSEEELDAVTGLSGSGPAFVAYLIDRFIAAGVAEGLAVEVATELTLKTFEGTAQLLAQWKLSPQELIEMVSSPNGTTVAGRGVLEESEVSDVIKRTVARAAQRSRELGK